MKLLLLFAIIGLTTGIYAQSVNKGVFIAECSKYFSADYSINKKRSIKSSEFNSSPFTLKFKTPFLKEASLLIFESKKEIASRTKLRFKILVYQYASGNAAKKKFDELKMVKVTQDESVFGKDWDYVLLCQDIIIRLDAGCLYSEKSWDKLREEFIKIKTKTINKVQEEAIECICGGSCK